MKKELSCIVSIHEENMNGKNVIIAECVELGVSDFGDTLNDALNNLKKSINLFLDTYPEKKKLLDKEKDIIFKLKI